MRWIKRSYIFWAMLVSFALGATYTILCLGLFLIALIGLKTNIVFESGVMGSYQRYLYFNGYRHIWQGDPACVEFDEWLLYRPKQGRCRFSNTEFDTVLNFDKLGRLGNTHSQLNAVNGIAVLGDSHAMGWGVNDDETFSSLLGKKKNVNIYNLAVASYGTYRELLSLERSGLLSKIDTIILQYCDNDINENMAATAKKKKYDASALNVLFSEYSPSRIGVASRWVSYALMAPFEFKGLNDPPAESFKPHFEEFAKVTSYFPWLKTKRVIVFYSNGWGAPFKDFSDYHIDDLPMLRFVELGLSKKNYFPLDEHPKVAGHQEIAEKIAEHLKVETKGF